MGGALLLLGVNRKILILSQAISKFRPTHIVAFMVPVVLYEHRLDKVGHRLLEELVDHLEAIRITQAVFAENSDRSDQSLPMLLVSLRFKFGHFSLC